MNACKSVEAIKAYELMPVLRRDFLRLDLNESNWGCAPSVVAALQKIPAETVGFYPDYRDLQAEIELQLGLQPDQYILSNGADDGIRAVMQTFLEKDDQVVLAEPSFGMIALHANVVGAEVQTIPYQENLLFPFDGFLRAASGKPRLIGVVRPDSPCGDAITREQLVQLLECASNSLVMLDETYHHFLGDTCLDLLKTYPNLIILQSFSKAVGLAGLRLGMVAAHPAVVRELRKVNPPFAVNAVATLAGVAALQAGDFIRQVVVEMKEEKRWLIENISRLGIKTRDSKANFVLADLGEAAEKVHADLLAAGILVKNLSAIPLLKGHFRIAVAPREAGLQLINALQKSFQSQQLSIKRALK